MGKVVEPIEENRGWYTISFGEVLSTIPFQEML